MNWVYSPWGITEWASPADAERLLLVLALRDQMDAEGQSPLAPLAPLLELYHG